MSKKKKLVNQTRDAPQKRSIVGLCSFDAYTALTTSGYTSLSRCPEVRMCVDVYADLISSMTLH